MDDEFKLCWKNFQDNIASGFQNLYDRGDLVDVTLACDGKLLHAHKIVLAICSPYFQEIFTTNPCKHPIIILKDVSFNIMCELLEFMYQGVVNVKHTELQSFMKIGQLLQIKGLATNPSSSTASTTSEKSTVPSQNPTDESINNCNDTGVGSSSAINARNSNNQTPNNNENSNSAKSSNALAAAKAPQSSPPSSPTPISFTSSLTQQNFKPSAHEANTSHQQTHSYHGGVGYKRHSDYATDALSVYSRKQIRRSLNAMDHSSDHNDNSETGSAIDQVNNDEFYMHSIPHISMVESRYDLHNVKREGDHLGSSAPSTTSLRNSFGPPFGFDYNLYKNNSASSNSVTEYPNELHMPNDYSKNFANHMDIPPTGNNVVMLSSTSLLHGNCVFNRNNTVATHSGMKTYWLCKSYRVSMCRARCITHQGRVISATGSHNHPPHMRNGGNNSTSIGPNSAPGTGVVIATATAGSNFSIEAATQSSAAGQSNNSNSNSSITVANPNGGIVNNLLGCPSLNLNSANLRFSQPPAVSNIYTHCSPHAPANLQAHHQQSQQPIASSHISTTIAAPATSSNSLVSGHGHGHHLGAPLPNVLIHQHASGGPQPQGQPQTQSQQPATVNQHLHVGSSHSSQSQHNSSSIMMHNANMMHLTSIPHILHSGQDGEQLSPQIVANHGQGPHQNQNQSQHQNQHHHPHHNQAHQHDVGTNLEITRLIQSSPGQMQSPSSRNNQSQSQTQAHHGGNSMSSPLPASSVGLSSSPASSNVNDDAHITTESGGLQSTNNNNNNNNNALASPADMHASTTGGPDRVGSVQSDGGNSDSSHQVHVIDSITISPGNATFKMENI